MPGGLTELTEITTALGMLSPTLGEALTSRPSQLANVSEEAWDRLRETHRESSHTRSFETSFANGQSFLLATDGLRGRMPQRVEWKGPHRPPGDDVIPADLRIDHVFLVSCKYLSDILLNPGPQRLFERLLVGEERSNANWFETTAPSEFQSLYVAAQSYAPSPSFPAAVSDLTSLQQRALKQTFSARAWPEPLRKPWSDLCGAVALESTRRWTAAMSTPRDQLRLLWRLLRITTATYFVLGAAGADHLRIRVDSAWDWMQKYELLRFDVSPRKAGQPEVAWTAIVRRRSNRSEVSVMGHVEIRWSHGRFLGSPESKVYLDTPHSLVPGYNALV
ncbi:hypothetical protein BH10ACT2_BH10ACT2_19770 [soil metagenome]